MGIINRLDHRGHGPVAEWEGESGAAVAARVFAEHQAKGYTMFKLDGGTGELLRSFDPAAEEILAVPAMQAG
jgi:hypothetical protein